MPVALAAGGESTRGRRDLRDVANNGGGGGGGGGSSVVGSLRGLGRTAGKRMRVRVGIGSVFMLHETILHLDSSSGRWFVQGSLTPSVFPSNNVLGEGEQRTAPR